MPSNPAAALLIPDFTTGIALHLSGAARLQWAMTGPGDDRHTGRRVRFTIEAVVAGPSIPLRATHAYGGLM